MTRHDRGLAAAGDELARPGDALSHSQPRNASPATLELVGLATERSLELAHLLSELLLGSTLLLAGQRGDPALVELVAPLVVEGVRDLVLASDVAH
jgi:hypothetical protein